MGAIVACVSGSYAGDGMTDGLLEAPMELHEDAATVTLWLAIGTALARSAMYYFDYRKAWAQWTAFALFTIPSRCEISMTDSKLFVRVTEANAS